jgi:hypothetical protein
MSYTYAELKTAIQDYTENTETSFVTNLPTFIKNAEQRIFSSKEFLLQKDVNFIQEYGPNSATTGVPKYYAYFDVDNFIVAPTPNSNYAVELHYYYRPTSLTAGADSGNTWLSENAPNAMLYGSLVEAYTFMKGEQDLLGVYEKQFNEALSRIKDLAEARENSDAYRRGLPDRPRT